MQRTHEPRLSGHTGNDRRGRAEHRTDATDRQRAIEEALPKVRRALESIEYGEVIIKVQGGKPIWVDKYERERVG